MVGQATARLESFPRRWIQTVWGHGDIDMRQKWWALWPHLSKLPTSGLRVLDAGCGAGRWALELAALRPQWFVLGIDRDRGALSAAHSARERLGLENVSFAQYDYFEFDPQRRFDVVLVVSSAHYQVERGEGAKLFQRYARWLNPGGHIVLLDTRWEGRSPFFRWLPHPRHYHDRFSFEELSQNCEMNGLTVEQLHGHLGPLGIAAKQLGWMTSGRPTPAREQPSCMRALHPALYPARYALAWADSLRHFRRDELTLMWVLIARASSDIF